MKLYLRYLWLFGCMLLASCGGGGSIEKSDGSLGGGASDTVFTILVSVNNSDGSSVDEQTPLSAANSYIVTAQLSGEDDLSNRVVTFTLSNDQLAAFDNDTGTAVTNDNGTATIGLIAGSLEGAGEITATVSDNEGADVIDTVGFFSTGDGSNSVGSSTTIELELTDGSGAVSTQLSSTEPLTLSAQLGGTGSLANRVVTFEIDNTALANFDNDTGTANTDSTGLATIGLTVGTLQGAGTVTASVLDSDGSTVSTSIGFSSAGDGVSQTVSVASVDVIASSLRLPSSGNDIIELTAIVKDENFILLENVEVTFRVNSGELNIVNAFTDANGQARAQLTTVVEKPNRLIDVTARAADQSDGLQIEVIGTEISINGPESMVQGDTAQLTIELIDSDNVGIAGEEVIIESSNGNAISDLDGNPLINGVAVTGTNGQITINYTANEFNLDLITVSAFNNSDIAGATVTTASKSVDVLSDSFTLSIEGIDGNPIENPCTVQGCKETVELDQTANLVLTWSALGTDVVGEQVQFSTTRGTIAQGSTLTTDANGSISLDLSADNAGPTVIIATGTRTGVDGDINVSTQLSLEFVASVADTLNLQTSRASIAPSGEESNIIATVRDPNGNLVKNKIVQFNILADTGNGSISPAEDLTDSSGIANTTYTSNGITGLNGVVIEATVKDTPSVTDTVSLTVANQELFITLGTGNEIRTEESEFVKPFIVYVTDVNSNPIRNKEVQLSAVPLSPTRGTAYRKGVWVARFDGANFKNWEATFPVFDGTSDYPTYIDAIDGLQRVIVDCYNEDANADGILDQDVDGNNIIEEEVSDPTLFSENDGVTRNNEDFNQDGLLTPGNVGPITGSLVTDDEGKANFELSYTQDKAPWVTVSIVASTSVGGTESKAEMIYTLEVESSYVLEEFAPPQANPFGDSSTCADTN